MIHNSSYRLCEPVPYMMRCEKVREDRVMFRPTWQLCIIKGSPLDDGTALKIQLFKIHGWPNWKKDDW